MIKIAMEAQAKDETLWFIDDPGDPFSITIGEAYMQQSLRWLHRVIEDGDKEALANILAQSNGDV